MAEPKNDAPGQGKRATGAELKDLPIEYLISAPLNAAIKAQVEMGKAMISFVNMLAYGDVGEDGKGKAVKGATGKDVLTMPMKLERPVQMDDGTIGTNSITVAPPILGLVPIPALLIETVDVDFSMEIKTVSEDKSAVNIEASTDAEGGTGINPFYHASVKVHGSVSAQRENTRSTDKTAKYDIRVHAAQQPPTEGMAKLMDLLASTVEPIESKTKKAPS